MTCTFFKILSAIAICMCLLCGCENKDYGVLYIGMPANEYYDLIEKEEAFGMWGYVFYTTPNNSHVVARCDAKSTIIELHSYKDTETTKETFEEIEEGMSVEQVVEIIGSPRFSKYAHDASGMGFDFKADDGSLCTVGWQMKENSEGFRELFVYSCTIYEK